MSAKSEIETPLPVGSDALVVPLRSGQWVAQYDVDRPIFGKVKEAYPEEGLIDLIAYNWRGHKLGRISPPLDGPTTFEPSCDASQYRRIEKPSFPMDRDLYGNPVFIWRNDRPLAPADNQAPTQDGQS